MTLIDLSNFHNAVEWANRTFGKGSVRPYPGSSNSMCLWFDSHGPFEVPFTWDYEPLSNGVSLLMLSKELVQPGVYQVHYVGRLRGYGTGYAAYNKIDRLIKCADLDRAVALHRASAPYRFAKLAGLE